MPAKSPRINVVLERPLYALIGRIAKQRGLSRSTFTRDLIRDALEIQEDSYLADLAARREASMNDKSLLGHDEVWK